MTAFTIKNLVCGFTFETARVRERMDSGPRAARCCSRFSFNQIHGLTGPSGLRNRPLLPAGHPRRSGWTMRRRPVDRTRRPNGHGHHRCRHHRPRRRPQAWTCALTAVFHMMFLLPCKPNGEERLGIRCLLQSRS
ncbi:uncharacterized protein LOC126278417 [Schistocerca gregaria]|uniref:uncharacterized protein LOC126278417 n=1 Tax=Schistocerca gregaria TaxID=7010 RepID=UPI00211EBA37|nr:uncharacterized protein LOC126278417 [Schistocerca gregaria]